MELAKRSRQAGYTLLEMLFVMVLLGIIMGIGVAGFDRMDPGYKGLQSTVETFLESSRDRARTSGHSVLVLQEVSTADPPISRLKRFVFRRSLEATFEPAFRGREKVSASGAAALDQAGRFGTGIDLRQGGSVTVEGRGLPNLELGFSLDLDIESFDANGGELLHWEGLMDLRAQKNGVLAVSIRAGNGGDELFQDVVLESPPGALIPNRWQHIKVVAADSQAEVIIDGQSVVKLEIPPVLGSPRSAARLGDDSKGWRGRLDEFTIWARMAEAGPELPFDVDLVIGSPKVHFDRHGTLDPAFHETGLPVRINAFGEEIASFIIGRFTQEVAL
ncbi:MAG: prepilin-type N-terminal cleavage/methylation domain-containing protein [Planctomycetota bacterium]|nr:prepilin-type N-terminal cleavage/methylation domain-containing protein [Planctomycetota bacterium]MDA1112727.1 prepilin-type N-terminal cleavage/methylation domain-containing protein [Planctomycetota bacterium]